jgi:hypothetical protein
VTAKSSWIHCGFFAASWKQERVELSRDREEKQQERYSTTSVDANPQPEVGSSIRGGGDSAHGIVLST